MLIIIKREAVEYGYDFVEIDTCNNVYSVGQSTNAGHGFNWCSGDECLEINVSTKKELVKQIEAIEQQGYKKVNTMYQFHNTLFNGLAL